MNPTQLRLLAFIAELERQHGKAHPRVRSIAGALDVSEATVHRHLRALKAAGLLKSRPRRARSRKQLTSLFAITEAGKVVLENATGVSLANARLAAFHATQLDVGVSSNPATGVSGVSSNPATGVSLKNTPQPPSGTQEQEGRVSPNPATPLAEMTPLNKEHLETAAGQPGTAGPGGRPPEPRPPLTGIPGVDEYILRHWERRKNQPPDPLQAQVDLIEARRRAREAN